MPYSTSSACALHPHCTTKKCEDRYLEILKYHQHPIHLEQCHRNGPCVVVDEQPEDLRREVGAHAFMDRPDTTRFTYTGYSPQLMGEKCKRD